MSLRLLLATTAILSVASANPVSFLKTCPVGDAKCAKESAAVAIPAIATGIPELGVETLDPVFFKKLDASSPTLKLVLEDVTFKGLKDCKPKKISRDAPSNKISIKLICDIEGNGQYEMDGRLLILPINGKGKVHIKLNKIQIGADLEMNEISGDDGKKYWNVKSWKHSYDLKGKANVNFENLFPGNELLGRAARELVASNGNDIVNEVGPPVIKDVAKRIVATINEFFHKVPAENLTLP